MRACRVGESAVLVTCADDAEVRSAYALARAAFDAVDVVPAARTVLIDGIDPEPVLADVAGWTTTAVDEVEGPQVELRVSYDGPDLAWLADFWGVSVEAAVARHRDLEYRVAFCGFAPGFAYCSGLPEEHAVPRMDTPRSRVPRGSVGVADTWTGVYPTSSPGGWRLIGHTDAVLWRTDREPPALLVPGARVRFVDG